MVSGMTLRRNSSNLELLTGVGQSDCCEYKKKNENRKSSL